ncbi:MAG: hypothetical protein II292_02820, partial [Clostridia bacterium]|nr:hypothetical protein [Clostridia bacterium]
EPYGEHRFFLADIDSAIFAFDLHFLTSLLLFLVICLYIVAYIPRGFCQFPSAFKKENKRDKGLHFLPFFCHKASFIFKKQKFYGLFSKKSQKIFTLLLNFFIIVVQCMCKQNLWR